MTKMTAEALLSLCKRYNLYVTPDLNEQLYCSFQGFSSINALQEYQGLRSLFLEGNILSDLDTMPILPHLRCLFLQQNILESLEGLSLKAPNLTILDISNNQLTDFNMGECTSLSTLLASNNKLSSAQSIEHLAACCPNICTLDLKDNQLSDFDALLQILSCLPHLKCLYLTGNPLVKSTINYRTRVIARLKNLTYLDDDPVKQEYLDLITNENV